MESNLKARIEIGRKTVELLRKIADTYDQRLTVTEQGGSVLELDKLICIERYLWEEFDTNEKMSHRYLIREEGKNLLGSL